MGARRGERGSFLAELLAATALLLVVGSFILQQGASYQRAYRRAQVQTAAEGLAADLRLLQQQAYFSEGSMESIRGAGDKAGYVWYAASGQRPRSFAAMGCDGVELVRSSTVRFNKGGVPSSQASYVLGHRAEPACQYLIEVQPVTGRVVVSAR